MNNDQKATTAAVVSAAGYGATLAPLIDPSMAMLLPPPWNFVALGVGILAQVIHGIVTNKREGT